MSRSPRILIADGNIKDRNDAVKAVGDELSSERYANEILRMFPKADITILYPAYAGDYLPPGTALTDFDGMVLGGSGLHAFDQVPEVTRQVDLMRDALDAGLPVLGSCWGLQVAAATTGGTVGKSPRGREVGIARKIALTNAGLGHGLYADKPSVFDSPCIHYDEVTHLPTGAVTLASNSHSTVQAAVIRKGDGVFWGMQYHPEFDVRHIASLYRFFNTDMLKDGFFSDQDDLESYAGKLDALHQNPTRTDIKWQLGVDNDILDPELRCREIRNWVECLDLSS